MSYSLDWLSPCEVRIGVTIPCGHINAAAEGTRNDDSRRAAFRKLAEDIVQNVLERESLVPVGRLLLDGTPPEQGKDFPLIARIEVLPRVELPEDLTRLTVRVGTADPDPQEVQQMTLALLRQHARREKLPKAHPAGNGDVAEIAITSTCDGVYIPGMQSRHFHFRLGDGNFPDLDAIVFGLHTGETGKGDTTCPGIYSQSGLRGRRISLEAVVLGLYHETLPDFDDAFAQKLGVKDVRTLKMALIKDALRRHLDRVRHEGSRRLLHELLEQYEIPVPQCLLERCLKEYLDGIAQGLSRDGFDEAGVSERMEGLREIGLAHAREQARAQVFLLALARREGIEASEEEADEWIRGLAGAQGTDYVSMRRAVWESSAISDLRERIVVNKALELLYAKARKIPVKSV